MNKEFVPYELAVKLKELGFDEACLKTMLDFDITYESDVKMPLYQQAFRWFRDKKLSDMCICRYQSRDDGGIYYYYHITHDFGVEEIKHFKEGFISYEEAELACLNKLIEIVQGGKK